MYMCVLSGDLCVSLDKIRRGYINKGYRVGYRARPTHILFFQSNQYEASLLSNRELVAERERRERQTQTGYFLFLLLLWCVLPWLMLEAGARGSGLQRVELSWRDRGRSCCMTIKRER